MDGHFVPNITFGFAYTKDIKSHTSIPLDVHLMVERPEEWVEQYASLDPWAITIHYESTRFPARLLSVIREKGIRAGISICPATPVDAVADILPYTDMVLVMSVDPGFYGQAFMPNSIGRIQHLSDIIMKQGLAGKIAIQVDGGVNKDNIAALTASGARVFVAGGSAFKGGAVNENVRDLKAAASVSL